MQKSTSVAFVSAAAVIIAAVIGIYPSLRNHKAQIETGSVFVAGTVVDQSNHGIGQAAIIIAGRTERYVTEDSGNFRIEFQQDTPKRVRLYVTKSGFQTFDTTVTPPVENLILPLRNQ